MVYPQSPNRHCNEALAMSRQFTREEFYELVWSKPMTHLAKEFAISDVALHKICKKHGIPNPPLGWWAKKAAGKPVKRTPLPKSDNSSGSITIANADLSRQGSTMASIREQARILASGASDDNVALPHPIIDRTISKLRQAKPSEVGIVTVDTAGLIKCSITRASIDRLAIALPRIARAASLQGFQLAASDGAAKFAFDNEAVAFCITESIRREKHVLTDDERAKQDAWQRKRDRAARLNSWDSVLFGGLRFPEWDYHPTGQLAFEIEHSYFLRGIAPRRSFRDGKHQHLENMASDIAVGLAMLAAAKTEDRLRRQDEERQREEERRRRERAARTKHIQDRRISELGALLKELDELDRLRRLMTLLSADIAACQAPRVSLFVTWAKQHLAQREASLSGPELEKRLEVERLFGQDDDHGFKPNRW
jgi:hypothetical protein